MQTVGETAHDAYRILLGERIGRDIGHPDDLLYDPYSTDRPLLDEDFPGVAREVARTVLPVSYYTEVYWKQNLWNLFHLLKLRTDSHAQFETRMVANAMYDLIKPRFPAACEAYEDYVRDAVSLSRMEVALMRDLLAGMPITAAEPEQYGLTKRELAEFSERFGLIKTAV
jgi:thymidylate synthase (FAD)